MRIIIAGDFTTEGRGEKTVVRGDAISDDIVALFKTADYNIVNLEAPLANLDCNPICKSGPHLKTIPQTIQYLKDSSIHAVTLANNHFCDYGEEGVRLTIEELNKIGIDHVGGGRTAEELSKPLIHHSSEGNIAFLNYCEHEFSIQDGYGSNPLSVVKAFYDIQKVKKEADIIIVIVHGGSEGYQLPSPRMKELYRCFVDMGANAVVNHHQHCYSGYEEYKDGFIIYGLGNFFFDSLSQKDSKWNDGYFVQFEVNKKRISKNYYSAFSPYSNRYLRYLCKHGLLPSFINKSKRYELLDYLECESHRDISIYSLKSKKLNKRRQPVRLPFLSGVTGLLVGPA